MAAGTNTNRGGRIFLQTCKAKDGYPYLGRYLKETPNPVDPDVVLDTVTNKKGKTTLFQRYDYVSGFLKNISTQVEEIEGKPVKKLIVVLADTEHSYQLDFGPVRSSYARQFLQRIIHPDLDQNYEFKVELYWFNKSDGTKGTALSMSQGDKKLSLKDAEYKSLPYIQAMPEGVTVVVNEENVTDYTAQISWLMSKAMEVLPADVFAKKEPVSQATPVPTTPTAPALAPPIVVNLPDAAPPVDTPVYAPPVDTDSLPF